MLDFEPLPITAFLLLILVVYFLASKRNLAKKRISSPQEYLWKLKQITGKSEYELFLIAAHEKKWPDYYVKRHFRRYLQDQTLPDYVKEFLEDGRDFINGYRPAKGSIFDKKVLTFYSIFATFIIGGSFIFCLYIYPRIYDLRSIPSLTLVRMVKENPKISKPYIERAISLGLRDWVEKACTGLEQACDAGNCEYYDEKRSQGVCQ